MVPSSDAYNAIYRKYPKYGSHVALSQHLLSFLLIFHKVVQFG